MQFFSHCIEVHSSHAHAHPWDAHLIPGDICSRAVQASEQPAQEKVKIEEWVSLISRFYWKI